MCILAEFAKQRIKQIGNGRVKLQKHNDSQVEYDHQHHCSFVAFFDYVGLDFGVVLLLYVLGAQPHAKRRNNDKRRKIRTDNGVKNNACRQQYYPPMFERYKIVQHRCTCKHYEKCQHHLIHANNISLVFKILLPMVVSVG